MEQVQIKYISSEEYFEMEKYAVFKSEYYHGELFAMSGASVNHNLITMNTGASLHTSLRNSNCFVFPSDIKVQVDEAMHYTYPDISIVCGDIKYAANRNDVISNPIVIIEILSKSTADYDKGSKFTAYKHIDSLQDYILIDQYSYHVEYYHKLDKMEWNFKDIKNLNNFFTIKSINVELKLSDIYYRVKLV